eukprot:scaffold151523_cov17-Tisochrysis_lutea.AAC.1
MSLPTCELEAKDQGFIPNVQLAMQQHARHCFGLYQGGFKVMWSTASVRLFGKGAVRCLQKENRKESSVLLTRKEQKSELCIAPRKEQKREVLLANVCTGSSINWLGPSGRFPFPSGPPKPGLGSLEASHSHCRLTLAALAGGKKRKAMRQAGNHL